MMSADIFYTKTTYLDMACMELLDPEITQEVLKIKSSMQNIIILPTDFRVKLKDYCLFTRQELAFLLRVIPE